MGTVNYGEWTAYILHIQKVLLLVQVNFQFGRKTIAHTSDMGLNPNTMDQILSSQKIKPNSNMFQW